MHGRAGDVLLTLYRGGKMRTARTFSKNEARHIPRQGRICCVGASEPISSHPGKRVWVSGAATAGRRSESFCGNVRALQKHGEGELFVNSPP